MFRAVVDNLRSISCGVLVAMGGGVMMVMLVLVLFTMFVVALSILSYMSSAFWFVLRSLVPMRIRMWSALVILSFVVVEYSRSSLVV